MTKLLPGDEVLVLKLVNLFNQSTRKEKRDHAFQRPILLGIIAVLLIAKPYTQVAAAAEAIPNNSISPSQADQFKAFIEHPPIIEDLFLEIRFQKQPASFYHLKWQSNGVFVGCQTGTNMVALKEATNLLDYYSAFSRFGDTYWQKIGADLYSWTNMHISGQVTNSITYGHDNAVHKFVNSVLNGGIDVAEAGSLRWESDTVSFSNKTSGYWFKGALRRDDLGRTECVKVSFAKLGQTQLERDYYEYDYYYDSKLSLSFLPSRIEWNRISDKGSNYARTTIIHSIKVGNQLMSYAAFSLESLLALTNIHNLVTVSNNLLVITPTNQNPGVLQGVIQDPIAAVLVKQPHYRMMYFVLALAICLVPLWAYLIRKQKKQ